MNILSKKLNVFALLSVLILSGCAGSHPDPVISKKDYQKPINTLFKEKYRVVSSQDSNNECIEYKPYYYWTKKEDVDEFTRSLNAYCQSQGGDVLLPYDLMKRFSPDFTMSQLQNNYDQTPIHGCIQYITNHPKYCVKGNEILFEYTLYHSLHNVYGDIVDFSGSSQNIIQRRVAELQSQNQDFKQQIEADKLKYTDYINNKKIIVNTILDSDNVNLMQSRNKLLYVDIGRTNRVNGLDLDYTLMQQSSSTVDNFTKQPINQISHTLMLTFETYSPKLILDSLYSDGVNTIRHINFKGYSQDHIYDVIMEADDSDKRITDFYCQSLHNTGHYQNFDALKQIFEVNEKQILKYDNVSCERENRLYVDPKKIIIYDRSVNKVVYVAYILM